MSFPLVGTPGAERPVQDHLQLRLLCHGSARLFPAGWAHPDLVAPFWRLYINFDPGAALLTAAARHDLAPRTAYLVPAWLHFSSQCTRPVRHFYIHFDLPLLQASSRRRPCTRALRCRRLPLPWRRIRDLAIRLSAGPAAAADLAVCRMLVSGALADVLATPAGPQASFSLPPPVSGRLAAVLDLVDGNLAAPLRVPALARAACCSAPQLARIFRAELGMSPAAYVRERRVATAATRLVASAESIDSIAGSCGFADRHHFSRVFTELMGVPPARYRAGTGSS